MKRIALVLLSLLLVAGATLSRGNVAAAASFQDVIINEVAWAGHSGFTADEWIELYNNTDTDIDLSGWRLYASDGNPDITLSSSIPAGGYYLIERSDDDTVSDIAADWTGSFGTGLSNTTESLTLIDAEDNIIDTVNADGGAWPAGTASPDYYSMERICLAAGDCDDNWASNNGVTRNGLDAGGNPINGTPKAPNSAAPAALDQVVVGDFTIYFLDVTYNPDGTSTWTYSVSSDCATRPPSYALSHWVLEICQPARDGATPGDGDTYTTLASFSNVSGRAGIDYTIRVGLDGSDTGISGIKYEDARHSDGSSADLGEGGFETDIFQFTLDAPYETTPVQVGTKADGLIVTDVILGPACDSTAIDLISFTAEPLAGEVTLAWETGTEIDNAGFNLYRAAVADGPYTPINPALIAAQGDPVAGARYSFADVPGYGTFFYTLEDIDLHGVSTLHKPVAVIVELPYRRPPVRPGWPR